MLNELSRSPTLKGGVVHTKIHLHYKIYGEVNEEKVKRAIELSQEKYCSVGAHLKLSGAEVTYSYEIIKEKV